jgi:hypothetical protein
LQVGGPKLIELLLFRDRGQFGGQFTLQAFLALG